MLPKFNLPRDGREPLEPNRAVNLTIPHRPLKRLLSASSTVYRHLLHDSDFPRSSPHRTPRARSLQLGSHGSTKRALMPRFAKYPEIIYERRSAFHFWMSCLFLFQLSLPVLASSRDNAADVKMGCLPGSSSRASSFVLNTCAIVELDVSGALLDKFQKNRGTDGGILKSRTKISPAADCCSCKHVSTITTSG